MNRMRTDALVRYEWSRYRSYVPGWKGGAAAVLLLYGLFLAAMVWNFCFRLEPVSVESAFAAAMLFIYGTLGFLLFLSEYTLRADPNRIWWLQLPASRLRLAWARFRSHCRLGYLLLAVGWAGVGSAWGISPWTGSGSAPQVENGLSLAGLAAISAAAIPVLAAASLFTTVFFRNGKGWLALLGLYTILWFAPSMSGWGAFFSIIRNSGFEFGTQVSSRSIWLACAGIVMVGWPLALGLLRLTAEFGLQNLADPRNSTGSLAVTGDPAYPDQTSGRITRQSRPMSPFRALHRMEGERISAYTDTTPGRAVKVLVMAGLAAGGLYWYGDPAPTLLAPLVLSGVCGYLLLLFQTISITADIKMRRSEWWAAVPVSRWTLVLSRIYAYWRQSGRWTAGIYASFWTGLALAALADQGSLGSLAQDAEWAVYVILLGMLIVTVMFGCFTGLVLASNKNPMAGLLLAVMIFTITMNQNRLAALWLPKLSDLARSHPDWGHLGATAGLSLPLAVLLVWVGTRYVGHMTIVRPRSGLWKINP
ncbi:hypothetical protein [Gorillibacterium sp. sgz5001074]|uniref:hypothetical protein n=1 Tax=Gorillibacterium sp. sgz5001074 TaxID=3446695 RepID=UPI003F66D091